MLFPTNDVAEEDRHDEESTRGDEQEISRRRGRDSTRLTPGGHSAYGAISHGMASARDRVQIIDEM